MIEAREEKIKLCREMYINGHTRRELQRFFNVDYSTVWHWCSDIEGGKRIGYSISKDGYKVVTIKGRPFRQHRILMEEHLGRKLTKAEVVHHINGDKLDNRIENLMLFSNQAEHRKHHKKETEPKICPTCFCKFNKTGESSHKQWEKRKFCSMECKNISGQVLTELDVFKIRRLYADGFTTTEIADLQGVRQQHVYKIVTRRLWKNI